MIIGITGYAGSGKDTIAKILIEKYGFERRAFADNVRAILYNLDVHGVKDIVDEIGWDRAKRIPGIRSLLQNLGVSAREVLGERTWIDPVLKGLSTSKLYVITDVRFKNEAQAIRDFEGQIWRVQRPGVTPVNRHISETELDEIHANKVIINGSGLDGLEEQVSLLLNDL